MPTPNTTVARPDGRLGLPFSVKTDAVSCANCPSAISSMDQHANIGSTVGHPICGLRSLPLVNPSAPHDVQASAMEHIAKTCADYGKPWKGYHPNVVTLPLMFEVAVPKPNEPNLPGADTAPKPKNCLGCANFVPAAEVRAKVGFDAPMCLARGALLLDDRLGTYPNVCGESVPFKYAPKANLDGIMVNPEYSPTFGKIDVAALIRKSREIEPTLWRTEKPVTEADEARGIRAWRRIVDPTGYAEPVYLPIFHLDYHKERAALIPRTGDPTHPETYTDYAGLVYKLARLWSMGKTPILWGIPGVGKTEVFRHIAWLMVQPFTRISITATSENDDIIGKPQYSPERGTYFMMGRLTTAYSKPGIVCLDEPNLGPDALWQLIRPMTDNSSQFVLDQHDGTIIDKNENMLLGMAANPAHDHRNIGANQISDADARRLIHVTVGMPPEDVEREIIVRNCKAQSGYDPSDHLDKLMNVARDIREASDNESINITWGLANTVKVAALMEFFPPMEAFNLAILNYLATEERRMVEDFLKSYYTD